MNEKNIGSSFDEFLAADGLLESVEEQAIKEIIADQIAQAMKDEGINKTTMAKRMKTSRQALDRLLDPENMGVTLHTMQRAAAAVGRKLTLQLS
ncbi:MAG: XRE family transcriptional regulator [Rhizobiales bacterium]|nr:XRE family transcriptional regulator [Hyphomicrobiales bacterium]